jgi:4'-phosphopantetheinyl transferase
MSISKFEKSILFNDAKILVFEITQTSEELLQQIENRGWFETELKKFSSEKRKREFIAVRLAMKSLLGKEINICYDADGKPYLADQSYQISISHSGNWIAVMEHPTRTVGIDIECPSKKIATLYTRFLSKTEQEELSNGKDFNQLQLAWSAKEALYKIIGKQAVDFIKQLRIFPFEVKTEGEITAEHIPTKTLYQLNYIQSAAYTLVYCLS